MSVSATFAAGFNDPMKTATTVAAPTKAIITHLQRELLIAKSRFLYGVRRHSEPATALWLSDKLQFVALPLQLESSTN
jgi:hypothetical protein